LKSKITRLELKLDKYKGPITKIKSKKLCILGSGKHIPEISPKLAGRNEEPRREPHEERQGGGGGGGRNQEGLIFGNQRRLIYYPLNLRGEKHGLPIIPKGTLK
jgi:hypothetical protein